MKKFFAKMTALVAAVVMLVACGGENAQKQGNYTNIIPTDATILLQADLHKIAQEGGIIELVAPYRGQLAEMASAQGGQFLKDVAMDLNNTGIATDEPVYGYVNYINENEGDMALIAKVCDRAKLDKTAAYIEENVGLITVKQNDGNTIITFDVEEVPAIIGFNDCALVLYASPTKATPKDVIALLDKAYEQRATPFTPSASDVNLTIDYKDIAALIEDADIAAAQAPELAAAMKYIKDCSLNVDFNIENGAASLKTSVTNTNAEAMAMIKSFYTKVENTHIDHVAADALAAVNININETIKTQALTVLDAIMEANDDHLSFEELAGMEMVKECITAIAGDVTLSLEDISIYSGMPKAKAMASTNSPSIKGLLTMATLAVDGLNVAGDDSQLIVAFNTSSSKATSSATSSTWYNELKDKVGYGVFNIKAFMSKPEVRSELREELEWEMEPELVEAVMDIIDLADYAAIYSDVNEDGSESSVTFELKLKERNTDLLKQIVNIVKPVIEEATAGYL